MENIKPQINHESTETGVDTVAAVKKSVGKILFPLAERKEEFTAVEKLSDSLIDEVASQFPRGEQEKIYDAVLLMFGLHLDQRDRTGGEPYVTHLVSVAENVLKMKPDKDLVVSALLHDSIEDQAEKISLSDIEQRYGERVKNIVEGLSEPDFDDILEGKELTKEEYREQKYRIYAKHVAETIEDTDCLIVKLADFIDNISGLYDLPENKDSQRRRKENLIKKYLPVMDIFLERLGREKLYPECQKKIREEKEKMNR
jgi:(p)ppGpp synthase/HD superfamily hydrolase